MSPAQTTDTPRVVVVTGASSGIGRAAAVQAAGRGDHLVLVARGAAALAQAAAECTAAGATSVTVLPTDVGDDEEVQACVEQVLDEHGRIDVVVHSAGVVSYGRVEEVPAEVAEQVVRTDLLGSLNVARHVVPVLRRQHEGTLVLLGSVIGHLGVPTMTPYVLSKWGVRALAHQLRLENRDRPGVHVRYVAPGGVDTPIYTQAANYAGFVGRPPPPVSSAERAAAQIWRRVDHGWLPDQLSALNYPMAWGRAYLPWLYDRLVGPLFPVGATDLTRPVAPTDGNVLAPRTQGESTDGDAGSSLAGIARNLAATLRPGRSPGSPPG
ncbi:SDR family NAD(P)-dependent oxidoreductase [Nocardioides flavescens]|nr:SDR family NAD(P)-dependent oxidoreductase [Nocardioides flavescens]